MKSLIMSYGWVILAGLFSGKISAQQVTNTYMEEPYHPKLKVENVLLHVPGKSWFYSHHPSITIFKNKLVACWSNGYSYEDKPGQRVLVASSDDFYHWSTPAVLASPSVYRSDSLNILTAAGFHQYNDTLVVYYGEYSPFYKNTRLWARLSTDGEHWGEAIDLHVPVIPNHGPQKLMNGRLVISGNYCFPYTDDYRGLSGWVLSSFYPRETYTEDNGILFAGLAAKHGIAPVCEGSFFQTADSTLHMLLRVAGAGWRGNLWLTESKDAGKSWGMPRETAFTDNDTKFHFGKLLDQQYYYAGTPDTLHPYARTPLVLSLSADGRYFTKSYIIADEAYPHPAYGSWKGNEYGYPNTVIYNGDMYIIISRKKEAIQLIRFSLQQLD